MLFIFVLDGWESVSRKDKKSRKGANEKPTKVEGEAIFKF